MDGYFGAYALVGVLLLVGILIFGVAVGVNAVLRPARPTPQKVLTHSGLRVLRLGQRATMRVLDGRVLAITHISFPLP